ncbi:MAG: hypothetical protein ACRCYU_07900 [Nocardioides sp.]
MIATTDTDFLDALPTELDATPWLAWVDVHHEDLVRAAVAAGAVATVSCDMDPTTLVRAVRNAASGVTSNDRSSRAAQRRKAERVVVPEGWVARVTSGVVALAGLHQGGAEMLLGLSGPGRLLLPGDNGSAIQTTYVAHTDVAVLLHRWEDVASHATFVADLRAELANRQRWSAARSLPHLDERLLEVLRVLEREFGAPGASESVVDVRVTHAELAMATGASRAAVTKTLGNLRARRRLSLIGTGERQRYCFTTASTARMITADRCRSVTS